MNINIKEFTTEVSGISSLNELTGAELGTPCLLIVMGSNISADTDNADLDGFFRNAPFLTALADDAPSEELSKRFDMVIPTCFIKARTGTAEEVLDCESRAFYRLMAVKNGGSSNE